MFDERSWENLSARRDKLPGEPGSVCAWHLNWCAAKVIRVKHREDRFGIRTNVSCYIERRAVGQCPPQTRHEIWREQPMFYMMW
jgi:hypothetical protein